MAVLLTAAAAPLVYLLSRFEASATALDLSSFGPTVGFALAGAGLASLVGGTAGTLVAMREFAGRRTILALSVVLVAAPPAFWWIGATRVPAAPWRGLHGAAGAVVVAGIAFSPIPLLFVYSALRELPANVYEAARVALAPASRVLFVLLPLLRPALASGFLLTAILLLGESELPFLFGFRTVMTDVVTRFSQTFSVAAVVPLVLPVVLAVLTLGVLAAGPLVRTLVASSRGSRGLVRRPSSVLVAIGAAAPAALVVLALAGYTWAAARPARWPRVPTSLSTIGASILEPVGCAWLTLALALLAAYPARRSPAMRYLLGAGLLLFCVPAAIFGIGWIGVGQALGGVTVPPLLAHGSRVMGLPALAFAVAYSRLAPSLEDAARLTPVSAPLRAFLFVLPPLLPSLAASAALTAASTYSDRDVASLLLPPGASRLMLDLYLVSANAPSSTVGGLAFVVLASGAAAVGLAAAGPVLLARYRG
jgi:iron(III) transport system permease protein